MKNECIKVIGLLLLSLSHSITAQEADSEEGESHPAPDILNVPFFEEGGPKHLSVHVMKGGITVIAHDKNDVRIEAVGRYKKHRKSPPEKDGLKLIQGRGSSGVYAEVKDNKMEVGVENWKYAVDLTLLVPREISLDLNSVNDGNIVVRGITGEMEIECINGSIEVYEAKGTVLAHALNRDVKVELLEVYPEKSMSFTSMNGDIDVTLPQAIQANVKLDTFTGDILSDFEIEIDENHSKPVVEGSDKKGRYRIGFDKAIYGSLNGGGELYRFETHNGDIMIRKAK